MDKAVIVILTLCCCVLNKVACFIFDLIHVQVALVLTEDEMQQLLDMEDHERYEVIQYNCLFQMSRISNLRMSLDAKFKSIPPMGLSVQMLEKVLT